MRKKLSNYLPTLIISALFAIWSALFIFRISFIAIDGRRYVNLFDDAMISMRYAWQLAHGNGLVWNPGEYVEGYTNLLMTLLMALVAFITGDKRLTVLIINIFGIILMLAIAGLSRRLSNQLLPEEHRVAGFWLGPLVFLSVLLYYPLVYWSLMGMETGLVTLLILLGLVQALEYNRTLQQRPLFIMAAALGLAYLTRPDALIGAAFIFLYLFYESWHNGRLRQDLARLIGAGLFYSAFIIGQQIFRVSYYGEWLPNTYILKATGMPLAFRLSDGLNYVQPLLATHALLLLFAAIGLFLARSRAKFLLAALIVIYFAYQIWVGGDAFPPYWRIVAPVVPLIIILALHGALRLTSRLLRGRQSGTERSQTIFTGYVVSMASLLLLLSANIFFLPEMLFLVRPHEAEKNEYHVNTALAINRLTTAEATIGVTSAGIVPFYVDDRVAIDFLGKSDKRIARLPADISGEASYGPIFSLPGHNKYDLNYSIKTLQPTYIQVTAWGRQDVTAWVEAHYADITYQGVQLYLRQESPAVLWEAVIAADPP